MKTGFDPLWLQEPIPPQGLTPSLLWLALNRWSQSTGEAGTRRVNWVSQVTEEVQKFQSWEVVWFFSSFFSFLAIVFFFCTITELTVCQLLKMEAWKPLHLLCDQAEQADPAGPACQGLRSSSSSTQKEPMVWNLNCRIRTWSESCKWGRKTATLCYQLRFQSATRSFVAFSCRPPLLLKLDWMEASHHFPCVWNVSHRFFPLTSAQDWSNKLRKYTKLQHREEKRAGFNNTTPLLTRS